MYNRLQKKFVLIQSIFVSFLFLVTGLLARHSFRNYFIPLVQKTSPAEALRIFDTSLVGLIFGAVAILGLFSTLLVQRFLFPIQKMWTQVDQTQRDLEGRIETLKVEREEQTTLMSAISDAILAVDLEGFPLFYNSRFALLVGSKELISKKKLWELLRDPEVLSAFQEALKHGKSCSVKASPFDLSTEKGFFSVAISPLRKSRGTIYGAVAVFHDVTDLKLAEKMRIDFVANVSHELRTPLTAIKGYADTLILDNQTGKAASPEFLEIIKRNTSRLMNLINDLLDLSSLESKDILQKSHLHTEDLTSRVIKQMHGVFEAKNQLISCEIESPTVWADPARLEQVLVNLLDNATKYTPAGGRISVRWQPTSGKKTALRVTDSGPGIPAQHHSRLFERFYRVDKARSREQGGTGLGLAIVKHIMQRHDGSIGVESSPGRGSTFICHFPD